MQDFDKMLQSSGSESVLVRTGVKELEALSHLQRCMLFRAGVIECLVEILSV